MIAKKWYGIGILFILIVITACGSNPGTETIDLALTPTTAPTQESAPVVVSDGPPCPSPTLGITLTMPSAAWNCEPLNDLWLKLTSPLFEVNISNLGRGPFCNPDLDHTCDITPFFANDIVNLQLYHSEGQAREIFGLAQFPDTQVSVWVAITWQDMATYVLTDSERSEIQNLVSTLSLLNQ